MNNLCCDSYLEWVRRCERDGWAVISIARNAHFEKPVVLGDRHLVGEMRGSLEAVLQDDYAVWNTAEVCHLFHQYLL